MSERDAWRDDARAARRELRQLLRDLARRAWARPLLFDPLRLARLGEALLRARERRTITGERAIVELGAVREREQARLLRAAVELRLAGDPRARLLCAAPDPHLELEEWLAACADEIDRALAGEGRIDGELLACCLLDSAEWPPLADVAESALRLDGSCASLLVAARAALAEGRRAAAEALGARLLRRAATPAQRASLRELRGCAREQAGAGRPALEEFERAAALGAGPRAWVSVLGLAAALDDAPRAAWAADGVAQRVAEGGANPAVWTRAAREVRLRWELSGTARRWRAGAREGRAARTSSPVHGPALERVRRELFG